jgi:microcin C transport system permease protein
MIFYILKRLLLIIPTMLGMMFLNFVIIQAVPGGPIEQILIQIKDGVSDVNVRLGGVDAGGPSMDGAMDDHHHGFGQSEVSEKLIQELRKRFGFDQPWYQRFGSMIKNYLTFDFGKSYFKNKEVSALILEKIPVSLSLGFWSTLLIYAIAIPLGIRKAKHDGSWFDTTTSLVMIIAYAIPAFLLAIFLITMFAGGSFWQIFPLRGLSSWNWESLSLWGKITDYAWHITLPITALVVSGLAKLTMFIKNSFLEEMGKQYVLCAQSKGLSTNQVLYKHVLRNAVLGLAAGFPYTLIHIFFTSSLLIEVLFSLDGLGLMGFDASLSRDYPVMFATVYTFSLIAMVLHLFSDILCVVIDRRITLEND